MASVYDWMVAEDVDDVDVYDCDLDMGRAWGLPYGTEAERAVQAWILKGCEVVDSSSYDVTADVWSFVEANLPLFQEYAREWTGLRVDRTDEGVANGVVLAMFLMSGEAAAASYPWLESRLAEGSA